GGGPVGGGPPPSRIALAETGRAAAATRPTPGAAGGRGPGVLRDPCGPATHRGSRAGGNRGEAHRRGQGRSRPTGALTGGGYKRGAGTANRLDSQTAGPPYPGRV